MLNYGKVIKTKIHYHILKIAYTQPPRTLGDSVDWLLQIVLKCECKFWPWEEGCMDAWMNNKVPH